MLYSNYPGRLLSGGFAHKKSVSGASPAHLPPLLLSSLSFCSVSNSVFLRLLVTESERRIQSAIRTHGLLYLGGGGGEREGGGRDRRLTLPSLVNILLF